MTDLYLNSLSLQEEIPRLSSVARKTYPLIASFLDTNPPPQSSNQVYVELGCGTGIMTHLLSKKFPGYTMYGIDLSPDLIHYAKNIHPLCNWIEGDVKHLPFNDSSVNYMLSHFTMVHISDLQSVASEISRCLSPGGQVLAIEPNLMDSDVDPKMKELFTEYFTLMGGTHNPSARLKKELESLGIESIQEQALSIQVVDEENEYLEYNYPSVKIGRMGVWSIFGFMGQLLQLKNIYNECLEGYMRKEVNIRSLDFRIHLFTKP